MQEKLCLFAEKFCHSGNNFIVMRHGHSIANEKELIVSCPENGKISFGLSSKGRLQVETTVPLLHRIVKKLARPVQIYCSEFSRTIQTADILSQTVKASVICHPFLNERYFGNFEFSSSENYKLVWACDAQNLPPPETVESIDSVVSRLIEFIDLINMHHSQTTIILVSHGDTLQILQSLCLSQPPHLHRSLPFLSTAEFRQLNH